MVEPIDPLPERIPQVMQSLGDGFFRPQNWYHLAAPDELSKDADMTPKQEAFVREYLVDLNATQAAIRAGYSKRTAHVIGHENLTKPEIAAAIEVAMNDRAKRTEITADYVLEGIRDTIERCRGEDDAFNPAQALKGFELLG
ncbi:terminase small subunit [Erythrobacter crassostreae]|nr:terminase small subunit [Erythrobacter crassostrea]